MAIQSSRAKATLDADTSGFRRQIDDAGQVFNRFGQSTRNTSRVITAAMSFIQGFGIIAAIRQAQNVWNSLVDDLETRAAALSRGAGGGEGAQGLRRRAQQIEGRAADPFRFIAPLGRLFATALPVPGLLAARALGSEQAGRTLEILERSRDVQKQQLQELININTSEAQDLRRLAANQEAFDRRTVNRAGDVASQARAIGLDTLAGRLEDAMVEGVVDTIAEITRTIQRQIAARMQERAIYDDLLK